MHRRGQALIIDPLAHWAPVMEDRHMSSKQKGQGNEGRGLAREKGLNVSEDSLQTRSPGSRQSGSADVQSANVEAGSSYLRNRNAEQGQYAGSTQNERGAGIAQQAGWSSRQQAQRMQARAEQERLGASQGAAQSGAGGPGQGNANQPPASSGGGSKQGGRKP
jgi:hypothetical protein